MTITLNGKKEQFPSTMTITELLAQTNQKPVYVAVEVNEEIIPREEFDTFRIEEDDIVEIVTFMGGGSRSL